MNLSNVLAKSTTESFSEKYFTCLIEESFVTLAIWGDIAHHPKVITVGTPKEWQELSSLTDAIEIGLEEFHDESEGISKVLFSLPESWVDSADIKTEYKHVLKQMTQKLDLQPVGFVVTLEALFHYIFQYKTSSVRTLFLNIGSSECSLYVCEHGKILQKEQFGRSEQFVDDVIEGVSRLKVRPMPAEMYFFSFDLTLDQLEEYKQAFLQHDWEKDELFSHLPTIDVLTRSAMVEAACMTGGSETLHLNGSKDKEDTPPLPTHESVAQLVEAEEQSSAVDEVLEEDGGDDAADTDETVQKKPKMFSFGIPISPKAHAEQSPETESETEEEGTAEEAVEFAIEEADGQETAPKGKKSFKFSFPKFTFFSFKKKPKQEAENHSENSTLAQFSAKKKKKMVTIAVGVGLIALLASFAGVAAWINGQRTAEVHITLKTVPVSTDAVINLDPKISQTDNVNKILKVKVVNKEVKDTQETSTTGSKIVGEKAKGSIIILNKTTSLKTFPKGTEVKSGAKVFLTDEDATVASASTKETGDGQTMEYGKKEVAITAKDIGADYNIDKDGEFLIANFSKDTYAGRNEKALSGGSSHEVQAVAKEDMQKLSSSLKKSLIEQAEKDLKSSIPEGEYLVLSGKSKVLSEEYSAKLADETNTLKLTMSLSVEGYTYRSEDLGPIAKDQLLSLVPDGGVLLEDKIDILSKENEEASDSATLSLDATLSSSYVPPTSSDQWIEEIAGKTVEQAKHLLSEKSEIKSVEVELQPALAKLLSGKLPTDKRKINLSKKVE